MSRVSLAASPLRAAWEYFGRRSWVIFLVFLTLVSAILIGWAIYHSSFYLLIAIVGLPIFAVLVWRTEWGLYAIMASLFLLRWISDVVGLIPRQLTWLPEIALAAMTLRVAMDIIQTKRFRWVSITPFVLMFLLFGLLSAILNGISPLWALLGLRPYFKYILMFYLLINLPLEEAAFKRVTSILIVLISLQVPVAFIQWLQLGGSIARSWDPVGGTLGSSQSGTLMILMIMGVCLCLGLFMYDQRKKHMLIAILFPFPLLLGDAMAGWFYLPIAILFSLRHVFKRRKILLLLFIMIVIIGYFGIAKLAPLVMHRSTLPLLLQNLDYIPEYLMSSVQSSEGQKAQRLKQIWFAFTILPRDIPTRMLGLGPGISTPTFFEEIQPLVKTVQGISVIYGVQLLSTVLEFGYAGLFTFFMILFVVFRKIRQVAVAVTDKYWQGICCGFGGVWFMFIAATIYQRVWNQDVLTFTFWFLFAAIYRAGLQRGIFTRKDK